MGSIEKALQALRRMPRVKLNNITGLPGESHKRASRRGRYRGFYLGLGKKGQGQHQTLPRLGFEGGNTPFYLSVPREGYYEGHHLRREYPPLSLLQLQRMIDLGQLDTSQPIDLATICNTHLYRLEPLKKQYGINLTDEGCDLFRARINLEVQWADEAAVAAVERCGGVVTTRFFDLRCLQALVNPAQFFRRGVPIPKCKLPPEDAVLYYTSAENRGYLARVEELHEARYRTAQKYGYKLPPEAEAEEQHALLQLRKSPSQIFYGLSPGWVVNLKDRVILKPSHPKVKQYYESEEMYLRN